MPAPPADFIPHRKVIRSWLLPIAKKNTAYALGLVVADLILFAVLLAATVLLAWPVLQVLTGMAVGLVIGRLFILGHDACHQSFTSHRRLNRWLGRLVFMPSLTPYSLWDVGHNVVHHGYTNLKDFDFVWQPLSLEAYQRLPAWRWSACTAAAGHRGCITHWRSGGSAWSFRQGSSCPRAAVFSPSTVCL